MKKLLPILLLIFSCEEALEPEDCAGVAGGDAVLNDCGICDGMDGYVAGSCYDCTGIANGTAIEDCLGVCGGDAEYSDCIVGLYLLTLQVQYNNLDCSGTFFETYISPHSIELNSDGSCILTFINTGNEHYHSWSNEGDQVLRWEQGQDPITYTFLDNTLRQQDIDNFAENCTVRVYTKVTQ